MRCFQIHNSVLGYFCYFIFAYLPLYISAKFKIQKANTSKYNPWKIWLENYGRTCFASKYHCLKKAIIPRGIQYNTIRDEKGVSSMLFMWSKLHIFVYFGPNDIWQTMFVRKYKQWSNLLLSNQARRSYIWTENKGVP